MVKKKVTTKKSKSQAAPILESQAFKKDFEKALKSEFLELSDTPIKKIISKDDLDSLIKLGHIKYIETDALLAFGLELISQLDKTIKKKNIKLKKFASEDIKNFVLEDLNTLLPSLISEQTINLLLKTKLATDVLIQVIHQTIVAFYKKINPIFGGLATTVLETQIKSFITIFIPQVQDKLKNFFGDHLNPAFIQNISQGIIHFIYEQNLKDIWELIQNDDKEHILITLKELIDKKSFQKWHYELNTSLNLFIFDLIKDQTIGTYIKGDELATPLARQLSPLILKRLQEQHILNLIDKYFEPKS